MRHLIAALGALIAASCVTGARATLEDRFESIGIPEDTAHCMVDDLDDRLSGEDLRDLARYTTGLKRADSAGEAIDALLEIDNPLAVAAIGQAAFICVTGFGR